jgi:hypothetical protein
MRALTLALLVVGCGGSSSSSLPSTTGLVVTIEYPGHSIHDLSISGATVVTSRHFGPYTVAASALPSGGSVGFVFDPTDAGDAMVCATAHDSVGMVDSTGCDMFKVHAEQIAQGTLVLQETH